MLMAKFSRKIMNLLVVGLIFSGLVAGCSHMEPARTSAALAQQPVE